MDDDSITDGEAVASVDWLVNVSVVAIATGSSLGTGAEGEITESGTDSLVGRGEATSPKSNRVTESGGGILIRGGDPVGGTVRVGRAETILAGAVTMLGTGRSTSCVGLMRTGSRVEDVVKLGATAETGTRVAGQTIGVQSLFAPARTPSSKVGRTVGKLGVCCEPSIKIFGSCSDWGSSRILALESRAGGSSGGGLETVGCASDTIGVTLGVIGDSDVISSDRLVATRARHSHSNRVRVIMATGIKTRERIKHRFRCAESHAYEWRVRAS